MLEKDRLMNSNIKVLQEIINAMPDILMLLDNKLRLFCCNTLAVSLFELPADYYGCNFSEYNQDKNLLKLLRSKGNLVNKNITIAEKDYNCKVIKIGAEFFQGKVLVISEINNITMIKDEIKELQALKDELDSIFNASYDYLFVTDAKGNVKKINESYTRITGFKKEEIVGQNIYDLVKKGYFDRAATVDVMESKKPVTFTQTLKTGKTVLVTGNPIFSDKGKLTRVVTNGRDITELNSLRQEVIKARELSQHFQREIKKFQFSDDGEDYIVASEKMEEVADLIKRVAQVESTVLVVGESGVGKEIVAREIHRNSLRADRPYICVNCAAIPENLIESELFGYEAGSFTGASKQGKMGIFQLADGGTLFLDEIGELPFYLQAKLLRVIQEEEVVRVGGLKPIPIDVRLITATNRDLWKMVAERQFREDLYYRLNVVQVRIPPLRERREEIPVYADYFIGLLNKKYKLNRRLNSELITALIEYEWPGNVRELRNALEQAYVTCPGNIITNIKLGPEQEIHDVAHNEEANLTGDLCLRESLQLYERRLIKNALTRHITTRKAAAALGVSQATVWRKAKQYGITISGDN